MLKKSPKPQYFKYVRSGAKALFVLEAVIFATSYGVWYRMNTSRDFRLYMYNNYYWILNGYYRIGESVSSNPVALQAREVDMKIWKQEGKIPSDA
ncbi:uncharacterized protein LOC111873392 isoform X2 [Cryptotermes secundus]|uniref:uncharacterized protein LOC111873392 isoform X2 n=1 Tax=Cryptotermes secundus TaxID=105785 RepID=UPI000CD7CD74|nr:uncharacterized protein LOC111873392 isoform X2 [Cryptotermes secundus]